MNEPFAAFRRRAELLLAAICLAACSGKLDDSALVLHFVTWKPDQPPVWDEAIRRFEAAHGGIHVEREVGPSSSSAFHDLLTQKLKNRDPSVDVFFMDIIWAAEFAAAGWARSLDEPFPPQERAAFLPGTIEANTWKGHVFGVPAFVDTGMLYYRKDLLEKYHLPVPSTWDELATEAERIVDGEREPGLVGYSAQLKQYEGLVCNMLELVASNGGHLTDANAEHATLNEPAVVEAVRWARDHLVGAIGPRSLLTYQEAESLALFLQGKAVFHRNWPYAWEVANNPVHSRVAGKVAAAPLPAFPGGRPTAALGGWQYGISAYSRRPDAAWDFVRFMTATETQRFLAVEASLAPTRRALYEDPDVLRRSPELAAEASSVRLATPRPVTPLYPAVSQVLQSFFSAAITDPKSDVEALARSAATEIDRYLAMTR